MSLSFITGKGGVGKTRISLLLSLKNSSASLAETTKSLETEAEKINVSPPPIYHFTRADLAEDFLISTIKIKAIAKFLSRSSIFQTLLSLAPNLNELLLLRQWTALSKEGALIVDAPSTGHFLALFDAVRTAQEVFDGGSLRKMADELDKYFRTENIQVFIVSLPEKSALDEMNEISDGIKARYPNFKLHYVLNRKHSLVSPHAKLPEDLRALAEKRVTLENERISQLNFEISLPEGGLRL